MLSACLVSCPWLGSVAVEGVRGAQEHPGPPHTHSCNTLQHINSPPFVPFLFYLSFFLVPFQPPPLPPNPRLLSLPSSLIPLLFSSQGLSVSL